jgi:hypothetical protein
MVPAILLVSILVIFPAVTFANHSWNGYHWARTSNPFTLKLGNNLSGVWQPFLGTTSSDWSASTVLDTTIVLGGTNPRPCKATAGRVEECNSTYGFTGWLGVAQIWISGTHITQGTVKLNDTYFNTAKYNTPGWRNLVSCQETGHTFGLNHQDETFGNTNLGTCMDYTNDPTGTAGTNGTLNNEHPNTHDYDQLVSIYSHLDSTSTVFSEIGGVSALLNTPRPDAGIDFDEPAEWGRLIDVTDGGYTAVYERDLGAGEKVITFVIWTDEARAARPDLTQRQK